jgi:hypothetical protein
MPGKKTEKHMQTTIIITGTLKNFKEEPIVRSTLYLPRVFLMIWTLTYPLLCFFCAQTYTTTIRDTQKADQENITPASGLQQYPGLDHSPNA